MSGREHATAGPRRDALPADAKAGRSDGLAANGSAPMPVQALALAVGADPFAGTASAGGRPLPESARRELEPRFGADLSFVRVHTDERVAGAAGQRGTLAFALGDHIGFGRAGLDAGSPSGRAVLAHEVAHVVQQRGGTGGRATSAIAFELEAAGAAADVEATAARQRLSAAPRGVAQGLADTTPFDITGSYEVLDPASAPRSTLQLNQAGSHVEGWYQRRERDERQNRTRLVSWSLSGDLISGEGNQLRFRYVRTSSGGARDIGVLTAVEVDGAVAVSLRAPLRNEQFIRVLALPRLSDEAIAAMPPTTRDLVRAAQTAPLDEVDEKTLSEGADAIAGRLEQFFATSRGNVRRDIAAIELDRSVDGLVSGFAAEQRALVVFRLQERLSLAGFASGGVTRPYWDWLLAVVTTNPQWTPRMQRLFGITARTLALLPGVPQHRYRYRVSALGLSGDLFVIGVGIWGAIFTIQKLGDAGWTEGYYAFFGTGSAGISTPGATVGQWTDWSDAQAPFDWRSRNFQGEFLVLGGQVSAMFGGGASYSWGSIVFYGDGTYPPMHGDAGGIAATIGIGAGIEVGPQAGVLFSGGRDEALRSAAAELGAVAPAAAYEVVAAQQFAVDDSRLTGEGWAAIRRMCALQRAAFQSSGTTLEIDGYTSTTGSEAHNERLAGRRATATLAAIREVLGDVYALGPENVEVRSHGEAAALAAGSAQGVEDPAWRKVEVRVNGRVVLVLR
jgi:outer membrane protein OmpA-like peptidoglycan-associated protein